jgi:N-acetylglucosaminyl-diphospho-decaprenol L-rhamnosyltransferase
LSSTPGQPPVDGTAGSTVLARTEVVLVTYRSRRHVEELLAGWPADLRVTVVDNSADVDGVSDAVARRPGTRYVDGGGQGFARGANLGAQQVDLPFVVFVNPDCRPSADDLAALVSGLAADPTAITHAATMTGADGRVESGVGGWEPGPARVLAHVTGLHRLLPRSGLYARPRRGEHCAVDWVTGACMAVRTEQFRDLGGFDETFYVYTEDVSLGRRGRELGLRSVLREDVVVRHGSGSSGAPALEMLRLRGASFAGYATRYHPRTAVVVRALMVLGSALRAGVALVRRDRGGARAQLAYLRGLVTRRAYVGGTEVAARRYAETAPVSRSAPAS